MSEPKNSSSSPSPQASPSPGSSGSSANSQSSADPAEALFDALQVARERRKNQIHADSPHPVSSPSRPSTRSAFGRTPALLALVLAGGGAVYLTYLLFDAASRLGGPSPSENAASGVSGSPKNPSSSSTKNGPDSVRAPTTPAPPTDPSGSTQAVSASTHAIGGAGVRPTARAVPPPAPRTGPFNPSLRPGALQRPGDRDRELEQARARELENERTREMEAREREEREREREREPDRDREAHEREHRDRPPGSSPPQPGSPPDEPVPAVQTQ